MSQKTTSFTTLLTKNLEPKTTFFIIADLKTCQAFWGFEQLSSTINWWGMTCKVV